MVYRPRTNAALLREMVHLLGTPPTSLCVSAAGFLQAESQIVRDMMFVCNDTLYMNGVQTRPRGIASVLPTEFACMEPILKRMMAYNPSERLSAAEACEMFRRIIAVQRPTVDRRP